MKGLCFVLLLIVFNFGYAENLEVSYQPRIEVYTADQELGKLAVLMDAHRMKAIGFPPGTKLKISFKKSWQSEFLDLPSSEMTINERGDEQLSRVLLTSSPYIRGEKIILRFSSLDGKILAEQEFTPYPLEFSSADGRLKITGEFQGILPTRYLVKIEGLEKGEKFRFESISEDEHKKNLLTAPVAIMHMPGVQGSEGGINQMIISTKDGQKVTAYFPYGNEIKPVKTVPITVPTQIAEQPAQATKETIKVKRRLS